jgi:enamine deaminase RidA (YjgF/YER057c/UK114 family)
VFGVWSKNIFADAVIVTGPAKTIYLAGMGSEDADTGVILYQGNFLEQCQYSYAKIKKILAAQGATMADIVKITTYLTDMRYGPDYAKCFAEAMSGVVLPAHTLVNISQLAWPGGPRRDLRLDHGSSDERPMRSRPQADARTSPEILQVERSHCPTHQSAHKITRALQVADRLPPVIEMLVRQPETMNAD